jgi:hypothetical protein
MCEIGGWHVLRDFDMLSWEFPRVLEILHKDYGVSPFFKISVVVDARTPSQNIIQVRIYNGIPCKITFSQTLSV